MVILLPPKVVPIVGDNRVMVIVKESVKVKEEFAEVAAPFTYTVNGQTPVCIPEYKVPYTCNSDK